MTKDRLSPEMPENEDSWANLAENLFGIEFGDVPEQGEFVAPEDLLEVEEPAPSVEHEEIEVASTPPDQEVPDSTTFQSDDESLSQEAFSDEIDEVADSGDTEEDTFWNPLNDWNWDTNDSSEDKTDTTSQKPLDANKREQRSQKKTPPSRNLRAEDDFSTAAELRDEYVEDSGFGAGLTDESSGFKQDEEILNSFTEPAEEKSESADEAKPRKTRRRRRRPRKRKSDSSETTGSPSDIEKIEEKTLSEDQTVEAEEKEEEESTSTSRKRTPRRRPSRRRKKPSDPTEAETDRKVSPVTEKDAEEDLDDFGADVEAEEEDTSESTTRRTKAANREVPTWEEAISYMLTSKTKKPDDQKSESKSSPRKSKHTPAKKKTAEKEKKETTTSTKSGGRRRRRRR